jgi:aryl-alcohol dehydrogenase-like predicted oxidoreductase
VPLLAYSPLAMGLLTDKSRSGALPKDGRLGRFADFGVRYKKPRVLEAMKRYAAVADKHKLSLTALALAFVRSRFFVASTIIGATSVAQLEEQKKVLDLELSKEALADIEAVNLEFTSPAAQ